MALEPSAAAANDANAAVDALRHRTLREARLSDFRTGQLAAVPRLPRQSTLLKR